jgi:hypothetical protein
VVVKKKGSHQGISMNIYKEDPVAILGLTPEQAASLEKKHIYFSFAYVGCVRVYKHNELVWTASGTNGELIEHSKKCLA